MILILKEEEENFIFIFITLHGKMKRRGGGIRKKMIEDDTLFSS